MVSDYYSYYIEVESISKPNIHDITNALMVMFARYGVHDPLVSDNGPQFCSDEFCRFATRWGFEHVTSPHATHNPMARQKTLSRP